MLTGLFKVTESQKIQCRNAYANCSPTQIIRKNAWKNERQLVRRSVYQFTAYTKNSKIRPCRENGKWTRSIHWAYDGDTVSGGPPKPLEWTWPLRHWGCKLNSGGHPLRPYVGLSAFLDRLHALWPFYNLKLKKIDILTEKEHFSFWGLPPIRGTFLNISPPNKTLTKPFTGLNKSSSHK